MAYRICYWDEVEGAQKERDSTPEEDAQRDKDIAEYLAAPQVSPQITVGDLAAALIRKGVITEADLK